MVAKIIEDERGQMVLLPKECHITETEVTIRKIGDVVVIAPKSKSWNSLIASLDLFSDDFMTSGR